MLFKELIVDRDRRYFFGFSTSFICLSMQLFLTKISQFYFSETPLGLLFSFMILGFSIGAALNFIKHRCIFFVSTISLPLSLLLFLVIQCLGPTPFLFYLSILPIFISSGAILNVGLANTTTHLFYFFDLLGGGLGIIYAMFSTPFISIETSISFLALISSLFTVSYALKKN